MSKSSRKKSKGFTLVELAVAATIAGLLAVGGLYYQAQEMRYQVARAQVDQLKVLNIALAKYQAKNGKSLLQGLDVAGVASDWNPTVAELQALGYLDNTFSARNLYSQAANGYATRIRRSPATCTGTGCSLFGLAYVVNPVVDAQNRVDNASLGEAISYGGGDVAASTELDKTNLRANGSMWVEANPVAGQPAGILAMRSSGDNDAFLPLNGSEAMTGGLKMGANDITDVRNFVSTGNVTAGGTVAAANVTASSAVSGATVTATGLVRGADVQGTNTVSAPTVNGTNVNATNTVTGANVTATNTVRGTYVQATNTVSAPTVSGTNVSASSTVSGSTITGTTVWGNTVSGTSMNATNFNTSTASVTSNLTAANATIGGGSGSLASHSNWWPLILRNGSGQDNAQAQASPGSAYVNDVYIRSIGKWASQLGGYTNFFLVSGPQICSLTTSRAVCPSYAKMVSGGYTLTAFANTHNSPDASYPDPGWNSWTINGSGSSSCFVPYAMCAY